MLGLTVKVQELGIDQVFFFLLFLLCQPFFSLNKCFIILNNLSLLSLRFGRRFCPAGLNRWSRGDRWISDQVGHVNCCSRSLYSWLLDPNAFTARLFPLRNVLDISLSARVLIICICFFLRACIWWRDNYHSFLSVG